MHFHTKKYKESLQSAAHYLKKRSKTIATRTLNSLKSVISVRKVFAHKSKVNSSTVTATWTFKRIAPDQPPVNNYIREHIVVVQRLPCENDSDQSRKIVYISKVGIAETVVQKRWPTAMDAAAERVTVILSEHDDDSSLYSDISSRVDAMITIRSLNQTDDEFEEFLTREFGDPVNKETSIKKWLAENKYHEPRQLALQGGISNF